MHAARLRPSALSARVGEFEPSGEALCRTAPASVAGCTSMMRRGSMSDHLRLFRRAIELADLGKVKPAITLYALRHSSIVRQLLAGTPIRLVAVAHNTSVAMIEKTYSRHIADDGDVALRRGLLDIEASTATKVVPLRVKP